MGNIFAVGFSPSNLIFNIEPGEKQCKTLSIDSESELIEVTDKWAENQEIEWKTNSFEKDSAFHGITLDYNKSLTKEMRKISVCITGKNVGEYHGVLLLKEKQKGNSIIQMGVWIKATIGNPKPSDSKASGAVTLTGNSGSASDSSSTEDTAVESLENKESEEEVKDDVFDSANSGITGAVIGAGKKNIFLAGIFLGIIVVIGVFLYIKRQNEKYFYSIGFMILLVLAGISANPYYQEVYINVLPCDKPIIFSPQEGFIYENNWVKFNISTFEKKANEFRYSDNGGRFKSLCFMTNDCGFGKTNLVFLKEGFHNITIRSVFCCGEEEHNSINFFVDTKYPKITEVSPNNMFTNGLFEIAFKEDNPKFLILHYGNKTKNMNLSDCKINNDITYCRIKVDLSEFEGQNISYWFSLIDISNKAVRSKENILKVDNLPPILANPYSFWTQGNEKSDKYFYFDIEIHDDNFNKVSYLDLDEKNPGWEDLCTSLVNNRCIVKERFRKGSHLVFVKIDDKAGNFIISEGISFNVESWF